MKCMQALFCGCENYADKEPISEKVYISIFMMVVMVAVSARIGTEWFIFKDYYPLKERSPVLCILTVTFTTLQLLLYPLIFVYNYFTSDFADTKTLYTTLYYAVDGSVFLIYFVRSLRLVYAHEVDPSRSKTRVFALFKQEYYLAVAVAGILLLKVTPIMFNLDEESAFFTFIEFSSLFKQDEEMGFSVKETIHEFVWIVMLIYCLALQSMVHPKYSMRNELLMVIAITIATNLATLVLTLFEMDKSSILFNLCIMYEEYPVLEILKDASLVAMYAVTCVLPLFRKKIYHMLLPTGRAYDLAKTMRDFLLEPQFLDIFEGFLQWQDHADGNEPNRVKALELWKQLMVIKYSSNGSEETRMNSIKKLIEDIEEKPIKQIHSKLIAQLKQSILSFEECELVNSSDSDKYRAQINEHIEELETIFLEKLDKIYKLEYRCTKSYYYLKSHLDRNRRINVNMILLNMAVMVDSEEAA